MRVGIMGGGQLGRMLALEGIPLGLTFRFLEPKKDAPVDHLGDVVRADYEDPEALDRFADGLDVVTYEFENVPAASTDRLTGRVALHPAPSALAMAQDRLAEKQGFESVGIPTAPYRAVDTRADLDAAVDALGLPAVLKTRRFGYDGKGQEVLRTADDLDRAWAHLGGVPLILEGFVSFQRELSILAVRGRDGMCAFYPLVENHHTDGILFTSRAPAAGVSAGLQATVESYARGVLEAHDYVGVLAVELFETADGLVANEMAPRVHNSGHWTQDGAHVSQFENHLRAVCGLPLGPTTVPDHAGMVNLLGGVPPLASLLSVPGARVHLYGKEPRPGRKVGHVNVAGSAGQVAETMARVEALIQQDGAP
ncbi:MAG: 5-(carboxyamino)imidazole ribonucleotide synthase [Longimicrobiales bacterium]